MVDIKRILNQWAGDVVARVQNADVDVELALGKGNENPQHGP
jgi:hypothetical protein